MGLGLGLLLDLLCQSMSREMIKVFGDDEPGTYGERLRGRVLDGTAFWSTAYDDDGDDGDADERDDDGDFKGRCLSGSSSSGASEIFFVGVLGG